MITPADSEVLRLAREWVRACSKADELRAKYVACPLAFAKSLRASYLEATRRADGAMCALFDVIDIAYGNGER